MRAAIQEQNARSVVHARVGALDARGKRFFAAHQQHAEQRQQR